MGFFLLMRILIVWRGCLLICPITISISVSRRVSIVTAGFIAIVSILVTSATIFPSSLFSVPVLENSMPLTFFVSVTLVSFR
jgi:hypothetical protein